MKAEFDMQINAKDLYKFNMRQVYTSFSGFLGVALPIFCFVFAGIDIKQKLYYYAALYIAFGILFLIYMPVTLWLRAKRTMKKGGALAGVLHYEVTEDAINVSVGEEKAELPWDMIYKMISTKDMILIYSSRVNAYILKKDQLGDQLEPLTEIAQTKLEKYRLRLKK